jgi:transcriptional regulator with XRE-family HTH domain
VLDFRCTVSPEEKLGQNMRRHRVKNGLSQQQVADRSGLDKGQISRLERGLRQPRLDTIVRIARAIGVAPSKLLTGIR